MPSTPPEEQPGKFSLSRILERKIRKQASWMFFETMVIVASGVLSWHTIAVFTLSGSGTCLDFGARVFYRF